MKLKPFLPLFAFIVFAVFYINSKKSTTVEDPASTEKVTKTADKTSKAGATSTVSKEERAKLRLLRKEKIKKEREAEVHPELQKMRDEQERITTEGYGSFPPVDLENMNPHKTYVMEALKNPSENSGTISIVGKRKPFDIERYNREPSYYLDTVEPGRAFDAAKPKEGVTPLKRVGRNYYEVIQNQVAKLSAQGEPDMPVSFTAFDGGHFQNGLSFITLKADASGVVTAEFTPTTGVINQCRIRAASPVNSGTIQWLVFVRLPPKPDSASAESTK